MIKIDKIFSYGRNASYGVPEGYFNSLKARLEAIPSSRHAPVGPLRRMKPYLALAACFLTALVIGNTILRNTAAKQTAQDFYTEVSRADLIPVTQPEEIFMTAAPAQDTISEEDVIAYLITSGASPEMIEYSRLIAQK